MVRGVVWAGRPRSVALALCLSVGAAPFILVGPATAGTPTPARDAQAAGTTWGDMKFDMAARDEFTGRYDPAKDPGSLYTVTKSIGARNTWKQKDALGRAVTGQGVTVAVLDSGVAAVPGLDGPGKIVRGPDLSLEVNGTTVMEPDTFGHGTHMASIIGGSDPVRRNTKTGEPKPDGPTQALGVAPDAQLLALKLATTDGSTDVSQVIAALDWVVAHKNDNGMNVRVVNLSFGTGSVQPYQLDPLATAAENAWRHGLVVVVSGGNNGSDGHGLTNPAIDPYVLAVVASDPQSKVSGWKRPIVADFSARGNHVRAVDLIAPGRSIVGFRAPGSFIDVQHPEGRVAGDRAGRLFRGSGTSQAAAVVSGAVALLLQAHPDLTPDAVKAALLSTADGNDRLTPLAAGAGALDLPGALDAVRRAKDTGDSSHALLAARQSWPVGTGTGTLEGARGGSNLIDPETGEALTGEIDVQGVPWDAQAWSAASATATGWKDGWWMRARWSGDTWTSTGWSRARWSGDGWSRARWSGDGWERARWSRARWSGDGWGSSSDRDD